MADLQVTLIIMLAIFNIILTYFQTKAMGEVKQKLKVLENMLDVLTARR